MQKRELLIKLREQKQWKQEDVAKMIGTTQQNISLIENGKRNPSIRLAKKFEILFKRPMEELFPDIFYNNETTNCNVDQQTA